MRLHRYSSIPEATDVGAGIFCIRIPQPFYSPNNIYVILGREPALIDSGYVRNLGLLQRSLAQINLSLRKIKHIVYTHNHIDHISAALTIRAYSSAKLYGMKGMAAATGDYLDYMHTFQRAMDRLVYKAHVDPLQRKLGLERARQGLGAFVESVEKSAKAESALRLDVELQEGDVIPVGDREIGFLHTPGHCRWHLTPYLVGEGIYFTGDVVLQNISAVYAEMDGNLQQYKQTLERLLRLPIKRILPGHGDEPSNPARMLKVLIKTLGLLEKGVIRRLKEKDFDLHELVIASMGERAERSAYYNTALAIIHSIVQKFVDDGDVEVIEVDPPYERYHWKGHVKRRR